MNESDRNLKNNPFRVPEGYFDMLSNDIMQKCVHKEKAKKHTLVELFKPMLKFAAGFAFLFGISMGIMQIVKTAKPETEHYLSQTKEEDAPIIIDQKEMDDAMKEEIITYLVDDDMAYIDLDQQ